MIKNNSKATQFLLIISLCLLIFSCKKEDDVMDPQPTPSAIYGTWTSGELSFHQNQDCSGEGLTLQEFADSVMINNIDEEKLFKNHSESIHP